MDTSRGFDCIYVSPSSGVHDSRWLAALISLGYTPRHFSRAAYSGHEEFITQIIEAARSDIPVIAGPLDIAQHLCESIPTVIFLSWGFDLPNAAPDTDLSRFTAVIVDSRANEDIARRFGAVQTVFIPWGITLCALRSDSRVADLTDYGVAADEKVVLSLRAHEELYRVADIIEAFAQKPRSARLVIGNDGSLTEQLRQLAGELGVDAVFVPPVAESGIPALLRRASVYVTASRIDGTSVTLLQAMACGVPIVASANAGNIEWIEDSVTGFLFPIADIAALNASLDQALDHGTTVTQAAIDEVAQRADWQRNITRLTPVLTKPQ